MPKRRQSENRERPGLLRQRGFTLVEVLTVATMISILATMAVVSSRGGKRVAFETRAIGAIKNIAENEALFYARKRAYGSWDQMRLEGDLVDPGYTKVDNLNSATDTPIANLYSIVIVVSPSGGCFTAVAFPMARSVWHMRTYATTCDGGILNSKDHGQFFSTLVMP